MELDLNNMADADGNVWGAEIDANNGGKAFDWLDGNERVWCYWGEGVETFAAAVNCITGWTHGFKIRLRRDHPHYTAAVPDQWGDPIPVNGARPDWLGDEPFEFFQGAGFGWINGHPHLSWEVIEQVRLPATHPYYLATAKGYKYWPGGDEAPGDWDGGEVLARNGTVNYFGHNPIWADINGPGTIIGYHPRAEPEPAPQSTDPDYVQVKRMTRDEADAAQYHLPTMERLGVILPETLAEQFERSHGGLDNNQRDIVEAFIAWQEGRE